MPRQIKDEYEIVEEIGAGGMAVVYKATQKSLKRPVAIKELKKSYRADGQIVVRFERESMVAASLQHENIVHIYDYWKKPNYCIVMEYVDGVNLAHVIERAGAIPVDIGVMIAVQVCSALDYAHMRGLIHRDIKPGNIMIKRNGEVKLMDFGIAHTRDLEALTMPGTLIGTPSYMSPEQVLGQSLDIRSDIFSFGIVLYELFTGVKPFIDDETRAVSARIVNDKVRPPRRLNKEIPRSVQRVIKKCLHKKPQKRFGSMLEIEKKLGKQLAGKTTKPASLLRISDYLVSLNVIEPSSDQETLIITSPPKRAPVLKSLAAAVLVLALAGGGYYYSRNKFTIPAPIAQPAPVAVPAPVPAPAPASAVPDPLAAAQQAPVLSTASDQDKINPASGPGYAPEKPTPSISAPQSSRTKSLEAKKERTMPAKKKKAAAAKKKKKVTAD